MIEHVWSVTCSRAIIDQETNNISLLDIVEQIGTIGPGGEGAVPVAIEVVTLWSRGVLDQPERGRARIGLLDPNNAVIGNTHEYEVDLTNYVRTRNRFRMALFPVRGAGKYSFVVEFERDGNWVEVARVPVVLVVQIEEAEAQTHQGIAVM